MQIEDIIRNIVRQENEARELAVIEDPVLLRIEEVKTLLGDDLDRSIIDALVHGSATNGFPVVRLSTRTVRIDKHRLLRWLAAGGLQTAMDVDETRPRQLRAVR